GRRRRRRADRRHRRGDEADEPRQGRPGGQGVGDPLLGRRLGRVRAADHLPGPAGGLRGTPWRERPSTSTSCQASAWHGRADLFEKVRIANRGEIALRVARACRELGIKSVAVFSTADAESAVVRFADEAVHIGPPAAGRSYLHIPSLIGAAQKTGADAIHPGYGFLSEDPYFAEICTDEGMTFIGPKPDVMEKVGDKATARDLMSKAGLPLLPGTIEPVNTVDEALGCGDEYGYPLIIKAVAGGGGR